MATELIFEKEQATIPPLRAGDRLSRDEFERRYEAMPNVKKAELIDGVVYMPSPASPKNHGTPDSSLAGWLAFYRSHTPGVPTALNSTVRLDDFSEPQPDSMMWILPEYGGRTHDDGPYIGGGPEWIGEIAASSENYDLHDKKEVYRKSGVQEYLVWRVRDQEIDWFRLRDGVYEQLPTAKDGIRKSEVFPGLWLDVNALLAGDLGRVLEVVTEGVQSPEHAAFVDRLAKNNKKEARDSSR